MIGRRTVLVLGAGASKPYGFPIGVQLVDQICREILDSTPLITRLENLLEKLAGPSGDAARFAAAMRGARTYSIDAFLETNRRFRDIGKAAIADVLLRAEDPKKLDAAAENLDWYRYLINTLVRRNTDHFLSQAKRLTIVTFNFDRSFERALFSALRHSFGLDAGAARQFATELRIHHVHGSLGQPDWLYPDDPNGNPYGVSDDTLVQAVGKAINSIKVIDDEIPDAVLEAVQACLTQAEVVCFIGFGFDERNLERLATPACLASPAVIRGTCLGKTTGEQQPIIRHFGDRKIHLYEDDALQFLRRVDVLFD